MTGSISLRLVARRAALVAVGGMLGTAGRLSVGMLIPDAVLAVLVANVIGALLLGILTVRLPSADLRALLGTGMLGGFTTYSALAVGGVQLGTASPVLAVAYTLGSVVLGVASAVLGMRLGAVPRRRHDQRRSGA